MLLGNFSLSSGIIQYTSRCFLAYFFPLYSPPSLSLSSLFLFLPFPLFLSSSIGRKVNDSERRFFFIIQLLVLCPLLATQYTPLTLGHLFMHCVLFHFRSIRMTGSFPLFLFPLSLLTRLQSHRETETRGNLTDVIFVFLPTLSQEKASPSTEIQVMQKMVEIERFGTMKKMVLVIHGHFSTSCLHSRHFTL